MNLRRALTLRGKIIIWFVLLHAVFAVAAMFVLLEDRMLLFGVEACFIVSIIVSVRLVSALFVPLELIQTGAELIAERDFTSRFVPVGQPEMDRLIAIYNDMIDRLREERVAAEEQQHLLLQLVQASPSGIVICDFDGKVQQTNPAADRLLQEPGVREALVRIEADALAKDSALATPASRSSPSSPSSMISIAGARRVRIVRAQFRDHGFLKSFYFLEELTEELRLTEKAAYEKLIRMMSHEVNNSVGAIRSLLDSLQRYAPQIGPDDRDDFVNALTISSARIESLNRFMGGFADVVRLPAPHFIDTNLADVLEPIARLMQPEMAQHGIELRLDLQREGRARIDQHQFEQVVINILRNAMESIRDSGAENGTVELTWRDGELSVRDTGRGIEPRDESELFTPFFTTKREGRGLGLTLVQEILTNHRARFSLANRAGGGAEFRVVFRGSD